MMIDKLYALDELIGLGNITYISRGYNEVMLQYCINNEKNWDEYSI